MTVHDSRVYYNGMLSQTARVSRHNDAFSEMLPAMRWVMITSVDNKDLLPQLKDFGEWLVSTLQTEGTKRGIPRTFQPEPDVVINAQEDCHDDVKNAYKTIAEEHTRALLVVHILPSKDAKEYKWMKMLSDKYGLIRQGVLLANALSRFEGMDLDDIVENILGWISKKLHEIVAKTKKNTSNMKLRVGDPSKPLISSALVMNGAEIAVDEVLKKNAPADPKVSLSAVRVEGFSSKMNEFQLASMFSEFVVKSIELNRTREQAVIEFTTKFQAAQAALLFNGWNVDSKHKISVKPMHLNVLDHY